jgi:hypothetical protein
MLEQPGDLDPVPVFSYLGRPEQHPRQVPCWISHTNEKTHDIIRGGLDRSPMYTGLIEGVGPRYCPSIEDKIHRFASRNSHQIFLEPEGLTTNQFYPNGISTSLPFDVQRDLVRSIRGLESADIVRPGYAIEYDFFDPRQLRHSLETKAIVGLYFAGQINGTTGYEEAAAQGMLGIVNAKRIWAENRAFWQAHATPLEQEIVFASTGVKQPELDPCTYVAALAGDGIQTNPPATTRAANDPQRTFSRQLDQLPPAAVLENVTGILRVKDRILQELRSAGYSVVLLPMCPSHLGEPLARPRIYFLMVKSTFAKATEKSMETVARSTWSLLKAGCAASLSSRCLPRDHVEVRRVLAARRAKFVEAKRRNFASRKKSPSWPARHRAFMARGGPAAHSRTTVARSYGSRCTADELL